MKALMILNDAPYGSEKTYNGLRLAGSLARQGTEVRVFLIGDAVACAKSGPKLSSQGDVRPAVAAAPARRAAPGIDDLAHYRITAALGAAVQR